MSLAADIRIQARLRRPEFELDADLSLPAQGISVLFGPSGCGKTSLLRCVAGLERRARGHISIAGDVWQDDGQDVFVPTYDRALGYVFQEASLFDHLDVRGNIQFALRRARARRTASAPAAEGMDAVAALLGLQHLMQRRTSELSGGERQRVAIARAIAARPRLLLLDEPLAALDPARRGEILPWLERLRDELELPMLYVTHSVDELTRLADRIVVLEQGRVRADGPAQEVLSSLALTQLFGDDSGVLVAGTVLRRHEDWGLIQVKVSGGELWLRDTGAAVGQSIRLRLLARDISLSLDHLAQTSIQNHLECEIEGQGPAAHASQLLVRLRCGSDHILASITRRAWMDLGLEVGRKVQAQVKSAALAN